MELNEIYRNYHEARRIKAETNDIQQVISILKQNNIDDDLFKENPSDLFLDYTFESKIYQENKLFVLGQIPSIQKMLFVFTQNRTHPLVQKEDEEFLSKILDRKFLLNHLFKYLFGDINHIFGQNKKVEFQYPDGKTKNSYRFVREWGIDYIICLILNKPKTTYLSNFEFDNLIVKKLDNGFLVQLKRNIFKKLESLYYN